MGRTKETSFVVHYKELGMAVGFATSAQPAARSLTRPEVPVAVADAAPNKNYDDPIVAVWPVGGLLDAQWFAPALPDLIRVSSGPMPRSSRPHAQAWQIFAGRWQIRTQENAFLYHIPPVTPYICSARAARAALHGSNHDISVSVATPPSPARTQSTHLTQLGALARAHRPRGRVSRATRRIGLL